MSDSPRGMTVLHVTRTTCEQGDEAETRKDAPSATC